MVAVKKKLTLDQARKQVKDLNEKWQRALADYANLEKRVAREKEVFIRLAHHQLLDKILPAVDELEICQDHLKDDGLKIVLAKFKAVLESEGVEEIEACGKSFDPHLMDAAEIVKGPKNKVMAVVSKGYRIGDYVLRPAKVKVGGIK